jgi:multicomponent Na+:H+ antiporter subunit F
LCAQCALQRPMAEFLITMAGIVLALVAVALTRVLRGPAEVDRMMAAQLLGTGSVAALLLLAIGVQMPAIVDAAVILALLAAFAIAAFVSSVPEDSDSTDSLGSLPRGPR